MAVRKIAILGGGVGALSAAFELTSEQDWKDHFEITVHQVGWRLGGKCATSRNPEHNQRIEEHGIHFLLGFYENAFHMVRHLYGEYLDNFPSPFRSWREAFRNQHTITATAREGDSWIPFGVPFPGNGHLPGDESLFQGDGPEPTPWTYLVHALHWLTEHVHGPHLMPHTDEEGRAGWTSAVAHAAGHTDAPERESLVIGLIETAVRWSANMVATLLKKPEIRGWSRQLLIQIDVGLAMIRGVIADGVLWDGFEVIDGFEFNDWLVKHGCHYPYSAVIRSGYDACFAYLGGDDAKPLMSAAVGVHGTLRLWFTYKGSIFWPMESGMAEVIFSPMYHVLKKRGVKFNFFHRVSKLGLSADGRAIDYIDVDVQAELKDPAAGYQPLIRVKELDCWPADPLYEQLVNGDALKGYDLESSWTAPPPVSQKQLVRGRDFDIAVLGISLGALPGICGDLIKASGAWQKMIAGLPTVRTQAMQLWLKKSAADLGYDPGSILHTSDPACVSGFAEPFDTYVDMTPIAGREDWQPADGVEQLAYFCTIMPDEPGAPPPGTDPDFPVRMHELVKQNALKFLNSDMLALWPKAAAAPGKFDWDLLVAPRDVQGQARFDAQYWRANVDPSAHYVLSPPGGASLRLQPDGSGFENLFLAGDWTWTPMNSGCVEAATMSGRRAAHGISGSRARIFGWPRGDHGMGTGGDIVQSWTE